MEYKEIMNKRKSNKSYSGKIYDDQTIKDILNLAYLSPSSFGSEPWELLVIRNEDKGKKLIQKLKPVMMNQPNLDTCSHLILMLYRNRKNFVYDSQYIVDFKNKADNVTTHDNESAYKTAKGFLKHIDLHENSIDAWSRQQTYILTANILNSAMEYGVSTSPMEGLDFYKVTELLKTQTNLNFELLNLSHAIGLGEGIDDVLPRRRFPYETKTHFYK